MSEVIQYEPSNLRVKIGTFDLLVQGEGEGSTFLCIWDTKTCEIDGKPLPPFRSMVIRCDGDSAWTVEMEFMPK